jgi:hypothetical protein
MNNHTTNPLGSQSTANPMLNLSQQHLDMLHASAISDDVIRARGYKTISDCNELKQLGFSSSQCRVPGLLLPLHTTDGQVGLNVYRPNNPRVVEDKQKKNPDGTHPNKVLKYEIPKGAGVRLDCPPQGQPNLINPNIPIWITEGQKKADALASLGECAIALLGVWNFKGKNTYGGITFLADWDFIALNNRDIRIVFDSDLMNNQQVRQSLKRLIELLQRKGAKVSVVYLPNDPKKGKVGVDDWLADGHSLEDLVALIDSPKPALQPAPEIIELLDNPPATISRPLSLLDQYAYAATWLHVQVTRRETLTKQGEITRHDPPIKGIERRLFIIRSDGVIFGETTNPIENLPIEIHLPEIPVDKKLWSALGVKAYAAGTRPNPVEVFSRLVDVIDTFIDFDRSLGSQRVMCEFTACYIMSTWFLDAFNVMGYIWPNGDRGCGKTHFLIIITELAYLGEFILSSGSFASLRDLADYGATLGFDDAEILSDPKNTDPDKRALLLAGNRRGVTVPVKELGPDKIWHTRHVNAFCPRLFSAIRLPDPILASRTIIVPLIRTIDRKRGNIDPMDYTAWPHDRRKLVDDLWGLSVTHLPEIQKWDEWVGKQSHLTGRNLQPWRAILAVAAWLDSCGVNGLWQCIDALSMDYQQQRPDLELSDFTILVIRSLLDYVVANVANSTNVTNEHWEFTTSKIKDLGVKIAQDSDGDYDPEKVTSQRVGQVFHKRRLEKPPRPRGQKQRLWRISTHELIKWATSYGIPIPNEINNNPVDLIHPIGDIGSIGDIGDNAPEQPADNDLYAGVI